VLVGVGVAGVDAVVAAKAATEKPLTIKEVMSLFM
jgi:hypothetical protein